MNLEDVRQTTKHLMLEQAARRGYSAAGIAFLQNPEISFVLDAKITRAYISAKNKELITEEVVKNYVNGLLDLLSEEMTALMEFDEELVKVLNQKDPFPRIDPNTHGLC